MPSLSPTSGGVNIKSKLENIHSRLDSSADRSSNHDNRIVKLEEASVNGGDEMGEMVKMLNDKIDSEVGTSIS